ncbi:hypothetical protein ACFY7C_23100 [Streptomyces sp. NPDC012769]|uniref:hypothetical protein n=1 Tax=Streptomyces sp. NPDC012769 TaxID=3364848 RepID=UPI0036821F3A
MPSRHTFEAFVRGCASDPKAAEQEWRNAKILKDFFVFNYGSTHPEDITSHTELRLALGRLVKQKGLTLRRIEKLAEQRNVKLRRSTLGDALNGRQKFSRRSASELARICGESEASVHNWDEAWKRAERDRRSRTGHLGGMHRLPAGARQYVELGIEEVFRVCERYGVPSAEIDMHIRRQTELIRHSGVRTFWGDPPAPWKSSVSGPAGDVSDRIEEALKGVLVKRAGVPMDWSLLRKLTSAVLHELRNDREVDGTLK